MDRKLIISLALSGLLLGGCSIERKGQLRDSAILYVTYATFSDYYKNGDEKVLLELIELNERK